MKIETRPYTEQQFVWPQQGKHIMASHNEEKIIVYQAYNNAIADHAVKHQQLGGDHFSYSRMSWIKPNFLWMMYRCGWAVKDANQQRVLAISIARKDFETILEQAVFSSFDEKFYPSKEQWQAEMDTKDVRLQWDPDHDPYGNKTARRAIQLGMKNDILERFGKEMILSIEDITSFVKEQHVHVINKQPEKLQVPFETVYLPARATASKIGLDIF